MNLIQKDRQEVAELTLKDGVMIIIRPYDQKDLSSIYEIERNCFSESERYTEQHLEMLGEFKRYCFLVAQENLGNTIVGYCIGVIKSTREGKIGHIISVAVHPNYRRRGIGIGLVKELMRRLKDAATYFRLEVKMTNNAARKFYCKLGFNYEYILRNYYGKGKDAVVMRMRGV